ncbi:MAG: CoA-binding protein [Phycisphaerae bacterium]|nr:MAG: CoA-binding protein [Phycisphaerae bacterium]
MDDLHRAFLDGESFAVAGASNDRDKYGNIIFRRLVASGRDVMPINPKGGTIEGADAFASIADLPNVPESLSVVTPPSVTGQVIQQAIEAGVKHIWVQPGAVNDEASAQARSAGINVIDDGACVLVVLGQEHVAE